MTAVDRPSCCAPHHVHHHHPDPNPAVKVDLPSPTTTRTSGCRSGEEQDRDRRGGTVSWNGAPVNDVTLSQYLDQSVALDPEPESTSSPSQPRATRVDQILGDREALRTSPSWASSATSNIASLIASARRIEKEGRSSDRPFLCPARDARRCSDDLVCTPPPKSADTKVNITVTRV